MGRLSRKHAVVTGGGRGIGRGIVLALAEAGADTAIADVDMAGAEQTADAVASLGREVIVCEVDVADTHSVQRGLDQILTRFGKIDILVNNAGIVQDHLGSEVTGDDFDRCYQVNLRGIWNVSSAVVSHFANAAGGRSSTSPRSPGGGETTAWRPTRHRRPERSA